MTREELDKLDRFCTTMTSAMEFIEAFDKQIRLVERLGRPINVTLTHELKNALTQIQKLAKSMKFYCGTITDFLVRVSVAEFGTEGGFKNYDDLQQDANDINEVYYWLFNAIKVDPSAQVKVVSYLKNMCKGAYLIDPEVIEDVKTKL